MKVHVSATKITSNFDKLSDAVKAQMEELIKETTEAVAAEYKQAVESGGRSGRQYGDHTASAPGEPPKSLTGELAGSVKTEYPSSDRGVMRVEAFFPRLLEFGTKRLSARPALRPIMEKKGQVYKKAAEKLIREEAKKAEVK